MILQDVVRLTPSIKLQNYKNYTAHLETLQRVINYQCRFFEKPFCMGNLSPTCKIFIERPDSLILSNQKNGVLGYSLFAYGPYQGLY